MKSSMNSNEERRTYRILVGGKRKERDYLEGVRVNGRVLLKWVFKR